LIRLKRAYDQLSDQNGIRVLVDRLWPRGLRKSDAMIDLWLKEIAPTGELRKWFSHDHEKWDDFKKRYKEELDVNIEHVQKIQDIAKESDITLLYSAKDNKFNNAVVLKEYLEERLNKPFE